MSPELSADQKKTLKHHLQQRSVQLREQVRQELLKSDNEQYAQLAGQVHDVEEESVADLLADVDLAVIDMHINELRDIEAALLRTVSGRYGTCVDCDEYIGYERLQAYPTAKRCLGCQSAHEKAATERRPPTL
jgi:RNA polymerase-binding transcription factor DksA